MLVTKDTTKNNFIATAVCDGTKRIYTVHNVTKNKINNVARDVGRSLFYASCVNVVSLVLVK